MDELISIVMPIYNTGRYLKDSIGSILSQTYSNFQLILVDDGSDDDETTYFLEKYSHSEERIELFHLPERMGAAYARNFGLDRARGKYILFLDSDDVFHPNMLEYQCRDINTTESDMVVCAFQSFFEADGHLSPLSQPVMNKKITDKSFKISDLGEDALCYWETNPWNKMCCRNFLLCNNIRFQNLETANDLSFSLQCAIQAKKICYCQHEEPLIKHRKGVTGQISEKNDPNNIFLATIEAGIICNVQSDPDLFRKFVYFMVYAMTVNLQTCSDAAKRMNGYNQTRFWLIENVNGVVFESDRINLYLDSYKKDSEGKWLELIGEYLIQLENHSDAILKCIGKSNHGVVIWGNGKRGAAFQQFCKKHGIDEVRVADKKISAEGITSFGFRFILKDELYRGSQRLIFASNRQIYEYLRQDENFRNAIIVNLELYCPY